MYCYCKIDQYYIGMEISFREIWNCRVMYAKTERHPQEHEEAEGMNDRYFLSVLWPWWDLPVPFPEVDLGENSAATQPVGEVHHVGETVYVVLRC